MCLNSDGTLQTCWSPIWVSIAMSVSDGKCRSPMGHVGLRWYMSTSHEACRGLCWVFDQECRSLMCFRCVSDVSLMCLRCVSEVSPICLPQAFNNNNIFMNSMFRAIHLPLCYVYSTPSSPTSCLEQPFFADVMFRTLLLHICCVQSNPSPTIL